MNESFTPTLERLIAARQNEPGALLPLLHDIQDTLGYVSPEAVPLIAAGLNLSRAEVHGVLTFYHHFRQAPTGRSVIQICQAEACQAVGAQALWQHACERLQLEPAPGHGASTADGAFTLLPVYCLGLCASSPALALNEVPHARMDAAKFDRLVAKSGSTT